MVRLAALLRAASQNKGHSPQWVQRHVKDRYVQRAKEDSYRSRAAYKLKQMDTQFGFLKPKATVVDLGCFAGGWSQVAVARTRGKPGAAGAGPAGFVVGVDLVALEPLENHHYVQGDIRDAAIARRVQTMLGERRADVVLSDMAPKMTGNKIDDHAASVDLCRHAKAFAVQTLREGGWFVVKIFAGPYADRFRAELGEIFAKVRIAKPQASRPESRELYYVCSQFQGKDATLGRPVDGRLRREGT